MRSFRIFLLITLLYALLGFVVSLCFCVLGYVNPDFYNNERLCEVIGLFTICLLYFFPSGLYFFLHKLTKRELAIDPHVVASSILRWYWIPGLLLLIHIFIAPIVLKRYPPFQSGLFAKTLGTLRIAIALNYFIGSFSLMELLSL